MKKRLVAGLSAIGLALAAIIVKGIVGFALGLLGWVGVVLCFVVLAIIVGSAIASVKTSEPPSTSEPPPAD